MIIIDLSRMLRDYYETIPASATTIVALTVGIVAIYLIAGSMYEKGEK